MTSWITICDTCKREGWTAESQPLTDGEAIRRFNRSPRRCRRGEDPAGLLYDGLRAGVQCGGASPRQTVLCLGNI
jgi:hypothetical protein